MTTVESEVLEPAPRTMKSVITVDVPDAGTQTAIALLYRGAEDLPTGEMVVTFTIDGSALNLPAPLCFRDLMDRHLDLFGANPFSRPHVLARRCRQYQRRLTRYEVSPYEIYARLYNRAHPARHISARRLNRLQRERALELFSKSQMPADYRRQR